MPKPSPKQQKMIEKLTLAKEKAIVALEMYLQAIKDQDDGIKPLEIVVLSYPRCGSHWVVYCMKNAFNIQTIRKIHGFGEKEMRMSANDVLVFIIRNYKECIPRNLQIVRKRSDETKFDYYERVATASIEKELFGAYPGYIRNLDFYDKFDGKKQIVYYEDLITVRSGEDISSSIVTLGDFFGVGTDKYQEFIKNLEKHKEKCLGKLKFRGISGEDPLFYSEHIRKEVKDEVDALIQAKCPDLYKKYLKRYEEQDED